MRPSEERELLKSVFVSVKGTVRVGDQETLVAFNTYDGVVDIKNGWMGVDGDGDGQINSGPFSGREKLTR